MSTADTPIAAADWHTTPDGLHAPGTATARAAAEWTRWYHSGYLPAPLDHGTATVLAQAIHGEYPSVTCAVTAAPMGGTGEHSKQWYHVLCAQVYTHHDGYTSFVLFCVRSGDDWEWWRVYLRKLARTRSAADVDRVQLEVRSHGVPFTCEVYLAPGSPRPNR